MKKLIFGLLLLASLRVEADEVDDMINYCLDNQPSRYMSCIAEQKDSKERYYGAAVVMMQLMNISSSDIIGKCPVKNGNYSGAYLCLSRFNK
jgi:hypothetical protein